MREKIYIGSYTNEIQICELNRGELEIINKVVNIESPSYLHINKDILYAVSEKQEGAIGVFKMQNHNLQTIDLKNIHQSMPCYISTNSKREKLLVANYKSGSVLLYELNSDGTIGMQKCQKSYKNANMHFSDFIGSNIYAIDLGNNSIYIYNLNMELEHQIQMPEQSGPRHLAVSKDEKTIYVVTELSNEIFVYQKNKNKFDLVQKEITLVDKKVKSYAGAIKISQDNKNIYVTNRGHNSIGVFAIKQNKIELIQNVPCYGDFPRDILLNANEEYAIVANQKSNNIVIYKRNLQTGELLLKTSNIKVDKPSCIVRSNYEI